MYEPFEKEWLDAEEKCDEIKRQRDKLREALSDALCCLEVCGKDYDYVMSKARAALKATEEEV